jgi:hypothetical protein
VIGDKFHPAAIAEPAKIGTLFGEVGKQAHARRNSRAIAAGINNEITQFCLRAGSAQRTIERDMPRLMENLLKSKFVGQTERAEFDHDPRRVTGIRNRLSCVFDGFWRRKAGQDDRRIAHELRDIACDCNVCLRKLCASRRDDIEANDMPSAIDQIACDRSAHDPEPDDSNRLVHIGPFPARRFRLTGNVGHALIA